MKRPTEIPLVQIGNSRGVRIPAATLRRYQMEDKVVIEERDGEIVLRSARKKTKLSWKATFAEMALEREDWSEWDSTISDGLNQE